MSLFREEVIQSQRRRLFGDVTIHQPVALHVSCGVALAGVIGVCGWLALATYARKETVSGWVTPEAGVSEVYTSRAGVVTQLLVAVDQRVAEGAQLATVSLDESGADGSLAAQQRAQLEAQLGNIETQLATSGRTDAADTQRLYAQAASFRAEATHLRDEQHLGEQQLSIAKRQLSDIQPLIAKEFISKLDVDRYSQQVIAQQQAVADLARQAQAKEAEAASTRSQAEASPQKASFDAAQLRSSEAALRQALAELNLHDRLFIRAPIAGRVTAINVKAGEAARSTVPLFAIAPETGPLEAEVFVPTRAAGFLAPGQPVKITVDAFPSQRFGTLNGRVATISRSPIQAGEMALPVDLKEPSYRVTARLDADSIKAYGQARALRPGMTLKAFITTARRSFLEWLLDPLLANR
ncbi:MAG: HlyD family efflux transporter periplasmic adaptor subunit [Phenylobacterium sp.]|nr:MAG: HlyD family efflux transporter periplasmic adaptor subunit [Phenylobacterium sp.]